MECVFCNHILFHTYGSYYVKSQPTKVSNCRSEAFLHSPLTLTFELVWRLLWNANSTLKLMRVAIVSNEFDKKRKTKILYNLLLIII